MKILESYYIGDKRIGIIDTPCYPCRYYAGFIHDGFPASNDVSNFFRTYEEAVAQCKKLEKMLKL